MTQGFLPMISVLRTGLDTLPVRLERASEFVCKLTEQVRDLVLLDLEIDSTFRGSDC